MTGFWHLLTAKLTESALTGKIRSVVDRLIFRLRSLLPGGAVGRHESTPQSRTAAAPARTMTSRLTDEVNALWKSVARAVLRLGSVESRLRTIEQRLSTLERRCDDATLNSQPFESSPNSEVSGPFGDPYPRNFENPKVVRWTDTGGDRTV